MDEKKNTAGSEAAVVLLIDRLLTAPKALWPEIWWDIVQSRWPNALGEEPSNDWKDYRKQIIALIENTVGGKACDRYMNVHHGRMTDQMFDDLWDSRQQVILQQKCNQGTEYRTDDRADDRNKQIMTALISFFIGCLGGIFGFLLAQLFQLL